MARYPGLTRSPINIDMGPLASYYTQNKLLDKEIGSRKDLSAQEFEQSKKLKEYDYFMNSAREVLKRKGFSDEAINDIVSETQQHAQNQAKFDRLSSEQQVALGENEPEVLYGSHKATLRRPGVENANLESVTSRNQILNRTLPRREEAEISNLEQAYRSAGAAEERRGLLFPYEQERAKNIARDSGMISLQPGIHMNVPRGDENGAYNMFSVSPEVRPQPGGIEETGEIDPNTGKPKVRLTPGIPAMPPAINRIGTLDSVIQRPTSSTPGLNEDLYEYRTNPTTGQRERRLRNPQ